MPHNYYVYILGNKSGTLYIGVTNDINRRLYEHRNHLVPGFTAKYKLTRLLHLEECNNIMDGMTREKQIKSWRRQMKLDLIRVQNPHFEDLANF